VCPEDTVNCYGQCANLTSDERHCGDCDIACRSDQVCDASDCVCPEGELECGDACADIDTDPKHCGGCDMSCLNNQICAAGDCACPAGQTDCDDTCYDLESDPEHCGDCDNDCAGNQICNDGDCGCPVGQEQCSETCVSLDDDADNCGSCGNECPSGYQCSRGDCLRSPCDQICNSPEVVSSGADGFRVDPLGTAARCLEIEGYEPTATDPRIVCWHFAGGRTLRVNGTTTPCLQNAGSPLGEPRAGGYCVQVGAGGENYAGILLPVR
jgi:hypothetical protein